MSVVVENLTKEFGVQKAVDNISFSVKKGEILGFLGPNGAGKSTTMKMLTGFLPSNAGKISISNLDIRTEAIEAKKKIGYLPENNPLYPDMYVKEFLSFVAAIHKLENREKKINEIIEQIGLGVEQHKKIGQLSKGYKQRVGLAQAIIHNPEILILDEPTSGLDPNQLVDIRNLIKHLGKEKTIIFSTHIMQEVSAVCDRVIIINKGKIVKEASIENIQKQDDSIKIKVSFELPIKRDSLESLKVNILHSNTDLTTIIVSTNDALQTKKTLFDLAVQQQNSILDMHEIREDLEDIFRQATKSKS